MTQKNRYIFRIEGIVQGVGFRPFVYTLAKLYGLNGTVLNNAQGVIIDIEGDEEAISTFEDALLTQLPPLARIDYFFKEIHVLFNYTEFKILHSEEGEVKSSLILPDMSLCDDCLREMKDPKNRRFEYVFTNCTNCGPRYSIIKTVPYDRPYTSMHPFVMCEACSQEYKNPQDRRYHAQPISCSCCGPVIELKTIRGEIIEKGEYALKKLAQLIQKGHCVAMKGMGGFHLMCDAQNDDALIRLREKKSRPMKPFAVMFKNIEALEQVCTVSIFEKKALQSLLRPIVLVEKLELNSSELSPYVAPHIDRLGVFLPYTPLHVMLFEYLKSPIVATSANLQGEPIISEATLLEQKLSHVIEYYLDYNREIVNSSDDSVVQYIHDKPLWMRLSRGLTPLSFRTHFSEKRAILAVGAHQKNAIALYLNQQVILGPYIGDLDNIASFTLFEKVIASFRSFYDFTPMCIVGDLHPSYASTQWAKKQNLPFIQIQHHYAHILSAMFEHNLSETVLGIAWDGTGYGEDGTIWGGELLECSPKGYKRISSFEPFLLLGGDASIKESRRVLASILWDLEALGHAIEEPLLEYFTEQEAKTLKQVYIRKINAPSCSSVGRLFDAVAVLCGMEGKVSYDGQSGLFLESLYDKTLEDTYTFVIKEGTVFYKELFLEMLKEKEPSLIATKFINALAHLANEMASHSSYPCILSGGVFQNRTLVEKILALNENKFILHEKFTPNDGGICMGQLYYALHNT